MENTFPSDDDALLWVPGDVLIEILVWLPVKSLLRFKSVCKSWRALIETSFFIRLHATTTLPSSSSSKFGTYIFKTSSYGRHYDITEATEIFVLSSSSSSRSIGGDDDEEVVFEVEDLGLPPLYYNLVPSTRRDLRMVGSCNGIICLYDSTLGDISLWNPATRQIRLLPKSSLTFEEKEEEEEEDLLDDHDEDHHDDFVVGFGFDVKTKDYKVVQITFCEERILGVQVYSLCTDSWRVVLEGEGINSLFAKPVKGLYMSTTYGLYLNGSYFFKGVYFVEDRIRQWVLSFDFTKEIFTPVQFPNELDPYSKLILTYFGGDKIALFTELVEKESSDQSNCVYDIWVLNEHHYHWTKLQHSIRTSKRKEKNSSTWYSSWIFPRFISNDGEFALIETGGNGAKDRKLQLFNLVTKEEKTVYPTGIGMETLERADVYKPSLVSIIGGGGNDNGTAAAEAEADWG